MQDVNAVMLDLSMKTFWYFKKFEKCQGCPGLYGDWSEDNENNYFYLRDCIG